MKVEKKIGKKTYEFTVHGENLFEAVMESKKLSFYDVHKCGCCGSDDLYLDAHVAQGKFKYVTIKCRNKDCKASVNFGQQQENDEVFYIRTRDKADGSGKEIDWKRPANNQNAPQQQQNVQQVPDNQQNWQQQAQQPNQYPGQYPTMPGQ